MREGWKYISFEEGLEKVAKTSKIASSDYKEKGKYPIVSQEETLISGFWDNYDDVYKIQHPVVIFGDHTRIIKFIDFNFVVGADGVKILSPKSNIDPKFFYYYLRWCNIPSLGYSRHYKLLKELQIPVPPLSEQERIVAELDLLTGIIDKQKTRLKELDTLSQSIFYDMFGNPESNEKGWITDKFQNVCCELFAGGDVPKGHCSSLMSDEFCIPILSNGVGEKAIYGYTDKARVSQECITISGRGTIGYCEVREKPFFPVVRLIVAVPKKDTILSIFLKFVVDALHLHGVGVAIPQLTIPMVKDIPIVLPPLSLQQSFAQKIQSIESQKASINQSIAETQKLFDYTMDKYFG